MRANGIVHFSYSAKRRFSPRRKEAKGSLLLRRATILIEQDTDFLREGPPSDWRAFSFQEFGATAAVPARFGREPGRRVY